MSRLDDLLSKAQKKGKKSGEKKGRDPADDNCQSAEQNSGAVPPDRLPQIEDEPTPTLSLSEIDAALKASSDGLSEAELSALLTRVMNALASHDDAIQDIYVRKIKAHLGINMGALRNLLKIAKRQTASRSSGFAREDHVELAERALVDLRRDSPEQLVLAEGQLYRFVTETGLWLAIDIDEQSRAIIAYAPSLENGLDAKDMTGALSIAHRIAGRGDFFAQAPKGIAFSNGFVSYTDGRIEFAKFAPEHRARIALPFAYRPNARARRWHRFLRQCFRGDADIKGKIRLLQEFAGACLLGVATKFGRALVLLGRGANGKSVFLKVLSALFPSAARASIPPQKFDSDYHLARLAGVLINTVGELPEGELLQSEIFKAVVTGLDEITARQIYKEPIRFTPKAGHVFAANRLPGTADQTHGYWRRFLVIEWLRIFKPDEQDKDLADKLIATEMPGIAAWVVEGALRVLARGRYEIPKSVEDAVEGWRQAADPVALFKSEQTAPASSDSVQDQFRKTISVIRPWTRASALYDLFKVWAEKNGFKQLSIKTFGDRLTALDVSKSKRAEGWYYNLTPIEDAVCAHCGCFRRPGIEHAC
jgi:putative DNA primase/helicase